MPLREILDALQTYTPQAILAIEADIPKSLEWLTTNRYIDLR